MTDNLVSSRPPAVSLLRIIGMVTFGFMVLGGVVGLLVISVMYDGNLMDALLNPQPNKELQLALLVSQGLAAVTGLVLLPWFYLWSSEKRSVAPFFHSEKNWGRIIASTFLAVIALGLAISPIVEWNANIHFPDFMSSFENWARDTEANAEALVRAITSDLNPATFILVFIVVALIPGVGEEFVFRGLIQTEMYRTVRNPHIAIWATAIFFSAFHLQFFGFVPRILIGAFLGYLYFWSGNLWVPMIGHFFNNGIQVIGLYLYQQGKLSFDIESTESAPLSLVLGGIAATAIGLWYLKNYFRSNLKRDVI